MLGQIREVIKSFFAGNKVKPGFVFGFFGLSLFTDWVVRYIDIAEHYIVEDGTKFLGIVTWGIYVTYVGHSRLIPVASESL